MTTLVFFDPDGRWSNFWQAPFFGVEGTNYSYSRWYFPDLFTAMFAPCIRVDTITTIPKLNANRLVDEQSDILDLIHVELWVMGVVWRLHWSWIAIIDSPTFQFHPFSILEFPMVSRICACWKITFQKPWKEFLVDTVDGWNPAPVDR